MFNEKEETSDSNTELMMIVLFLGVIAALIVSLLNWS